MDTIFIVGSTDQKLVGFLQKLGHNVIVFDGTVPFNDVLFGHVVDCIILDEAGEPDICSYIEMLSGDEKTKEIPIVLCNATEKSARFVEALGTVNLHLAQAPCTVGGIVSKVATALRLRKMAGQNESKASLGEINARLRDLNKHFEDDLKEAERIQRSLIPATMPTDDRFEIAASYELLEGVGGDWYYVNVRDDGKLAVHVADGTGHGLPAAFIAAMTKLAMTAAGDLPPDLLLTEMNRLMAPNLPEGRFVTIFSYLYDPVSGKFDYARGGHPPALWLSRAKNKVEVLKSAGMALGFLEESVYEAGQIQLEIGDVVLVYTDALTESQNRSGEMYDCDRIANSLLETEDTASVTDILIKVLDDFDRFREQRIIKDDVTLIALKRVV